MALRLAWPRVLAYLRSLDPRLPRPVWIMEAGGLANAFGNGLAFPFLFIYLHNVRGFPLDTVGLIVASSALAGIATIPISGVIVDRLGGRPVLAGSLVLLAIGFGLLPLVREPWQAVVLMAVGGVGNGAFWPSQSTLLAGLTPPDRRHAAYGLQRVSRNLGIGLGGLSGGLIATTESSSSYTVLFTLDAVTFLVFVVVLLAFVPDPPVPAHDEAPAGRYREVVRDRVFLGVVGLNALFVAAGYAMFELLPVYAKNEAGVSEKAIGVIFFVNTLVIVLAQLPLVKVLEGRRRMRALAAMTLIWACAWLVVLAGGLWFEAAAAAAVFGIGAVDFRPGGVLPRADPGRTRRRPRPRARARTLHGVLDALVGDRLRRRSGGRRLRAPPLAERALAPGGNGVPGGGGRRHPARAPRAARAAAHAGVGGPKPPPPGVSMRTTSPASRSSVALAGTSRPLTRLRPGRPGSPPAAPVGARSRRSLRSERRHASSTRSSRTTPSPPWKRPPPPEPRRSSWRSTRSG